MVQKAAVTRDRNFRCRAAAKTTENAHNRSLPVTLALHCFSAGNLDMFTKFSEKLEIHFSYNKSGTKIRYYIRQFHPCLK